MASINIDKQNDSVSIDIPEVTGLEVDSIYGALIPFVLKKELEKISKNNDSVDDDVDDYFRALTRNLSEVNQTDNGFLYDGSLSELIDEITPRNKYSLFDIDLEIKHVKHCGDANLGLSVFILFLMIILLIIIASSDGRR